jgi:hypothetical protein
MKRVEVHKYNTPTADNRDCPWSLGILNLTEAEADLVAQFARGIRNINSLRARGVTATEMRGMSGPAVTTERADIAYQELMRRAREADMAITPEQRKRSLVGRFEPERDEQPEPEEPRNRFSGLDI